MLPIRHLVTRVPMQDAQGNQALVEMADRTQVFLDPNRVESITAISPERRSDVQQRIPQGSKSIIRYHDALSGYRLVYTEDEASALARTMYRLSQGEDPFGVDYASIPNGV